VHRAIGRWKGYGGPLAVGDPDTVAGDLGQLANAGFDGFYFSSVAYTDELPDVIQEVLPHLEHLGLRQKPR
jgi:alkanesulfonate monooxygenase SsuD/methylene tetrahydromethanopterin reductase-like flavin-dependent oxidoreductase (luciferase family)